MKMDATAQTASNTKHGMDSQREKAKTTSFAIRLSANFAYKKTRMTDDVKKP